MMHNHVIPYEDETLIIANESLSWSLMQRLLRTMAHLQMARFVTEEIELREFGQLSTPQL